MSPAREIYLAGIDGGGTKTLALCGDGTGNVLGCGLAGPSNYQAVGMQSAISEVASALDQALKQAGLSREDLSFTVFGLSGADLPDDFRLLREALQRCFPAAPFKLVNDSWAAFRAGSAAAYGAVSVCGTGTNAAARNRAGRQAALRSLGYEYGCWGGAADLAREALHHAFRSEEGTGPKTLLEEGVLELFKEAVDYNELACRMREDLSLLYRSMHILPRLVFRLAAAGDQASQDILVRMGKAVGGDCAAVIKAVEMENEPCDVVLAGGMFAAARTESPLLVDAFTLALHRSAPQARPLLLDCEPAVGALLLALDQSGRPAGPEIKEMLARSAERIKPCCRTAG